jgi:hypothetical protein
MCIPACEICGCIGNGSCNHPILYGDCALYETGICPCCTFSPGHMHRCRKNDVAERDQMKLFAEEEDPGVEDAKYQAFLLPDDRRIG